MSQSANFPPSYAAGVGGVSPTQQGPEAISFVPPDRLGDWTDHASPTTPPFSSAFAALCGGDSLKRISEGKTFNVSEQQLMTCMIQKRGSLTATLALAVCAPFPIR